MKKRIEKIRLVLTMSRHRITLKLTVLIAFIMIFLLLATTFVQFVVVSRNYMTSNYTKTRMEQLKNAVNQMETGGLCTEYIEQYPEKCLDLLKRYERENTAAVMIFDSYGNLLLHSEDLSGWLDIANPYFTKLFQNRNIYRYNNEEMIRLRGFAGIGTRLVGFYHVILPTDQSADNVQAYYLVVVTREVFTSDTKKMFLMSSMVLFLIMAALCILIAFFLARRITKPVLEIRNAASRMAELDFSEKCEITGDDEISNLAMSINLLSLKLEETIAQLETANIKLQEDLTLQQETDRMRKSFIAAASHEFKTPLTILRGYMEMLQDNCLSEKDEVKAKETIIMEIERMDKMVLRLLELSRITADEFQMQIEPFSLTEVVYHSMNEFEMVVQKKQIHLACFYTEPSCIVLGDKEHIEEVIINMLSNAVKHTAANGEIRFILEKDNEIVTLTVYNQGEQIEEKELENIWEPFYMIDKSRSRKNGGTGLGLSICREILMKHHSNFGIRNVKDGVEVYFTLQNANLEGIKETGEKISE